MARGRKSPTIPPVIERFIKTLVVTGKAVVLYPPASNIPLDTANDAVEALRAALGERSELRFTVGKSGLFYHELPVFPDNPAYAVFAYELYARNLAEVRFHAGANTKDVVSFLSVLKDTPEQIETSGGFEARLWELGVATITVTAASVALVDASTLAQKEATAAAVPLSRPEIDELLAAAYGGRRRDQIMVMRLLGDQKAVASYLTSSYEEGGMSGLLEVGERFSQLAEIAYEASPADGRHEMLRSLGESLTQLDPEMRRALLVDELLPEARTNEAIADVVRQMDVDEVCRMLAEGLEDSEVSREGLARAIRTLAQISVVSRDDVVSSAGAAMRSAGLSEGVVSGIIETMAPSRLTVRPRAGISGQQDTPADTIFRLMDLAPIADASETEQDRDLEVLRKEATLGLTDGDVIMALVSLVGLDAHDQQFASTMSMLEDALDLLVERGELVVAADACDALGAASESPAISADQRERLRRARGRFTKPADIRAVAHALRIFEPGTPEHAAAKRLLDSLGALAIDPLLEQLADETDMGVRKSIIDVLSALARDYIPELGSNVTDSRWFVVRNVVNILGSTRSSAVLPYIERTLRHPEARVRREAIRALAGIPDRLSYEMLIAMLSDEDPQNVQLAARYLGSKDVKGSIPVLEQVARGEGRGNRDTGPRVEAIEALGKLGATESMPTLQSLTHRRSLTHATRGRALKAAAESAILAIQHPGGGDAR